MSDTAGKPNRSRTAQGTLEILEGRMLLSGGGHHHWGHPWGFGSSNLTTVADFNGDKKADLVQVDNVQNRRGPKFASVTVQKGLGNGVFVASSLDVVKAPASAVVAGDFNNDKNADVGVLSTEKGVTTLYVLAGNGAGKFAAPVKTVLGTLPTANVAAGDINGDGFADIVAWNPETEMLWVSMSDNVTGVLATAFEQASPFVGAAPAGLGDFFGDGRYELIGVGGSEVRGNMAMASTGDFIAEFLVKAPTDLALDDKRVLMADIDGDGRQDLVALGDGSVNVALRITDPFDFAAFGPWVATAGPVSPAKTLVGDVDGDGKADLFREGQNFGLVSFGKAILISTGDGTFHKLWF